MKKNYYVCFGVKGTDPTGNKTYLELETCIIESTSQTCADGEAIDRSRAVRYIHEQLLEGKELCLCVRSMDKYVKELTKRGKFLLKESFRLAKGKTIP